MCLEAFDDLTLDTQVPLTVELSYSFTILVQEEEACLLVFSNPISVFEG
jgi:hypothetical protein